MTLYIVRAKPKTISPNYEKN